MEHLGNYETLERNLVTQLVLFDDIFFDFFKKIMYTFLLSIYYQMWIMIKNGYSYPFKVVNNIEVYTLLST